MKLSNIFRADLKGKWLAKVNLCNAYARLADLSRAALEGADLQGANLQSTNLQNAHLEGAHFEGVNLWAVTGLTLVQLQAAHTDADTQLPETLQRLPPAGAVAPPSGPPEAAYELTEDPLLDPVGMDPVKSLA